MKTSRRFARHSIEWLIETKERRIGRLITIDGIVSINQYTARNEHFAHIEFVHNGYKYSGKWTEPLTKYQLVRRANKLVRDAIEDTEV